MLTFIHTYTALSFPALVKSGLYREGDGIKLMHKPGFTPPNDFNSALKDGSPLFSLLKEKRPAFYVDRLQGGVGNTNKYNSDKKLLSQLRNTPGGSFFGFQMHEWASNLKSDMSRISAAAEENGVDVKNKSAFSAFMKSIAERRTDVFLEAYTPEEWEHRPISDSLSEFLSAADSLYKLRCAETEGLVFPADSYFMSPKTEIKYGARLLLPECGWQIPNMRVQAAYTRGMAKSAGIPWGIYWECWQNDESTGFTIPFSLREGQDEWLEDMLHKANGHELPFEKREYGGSSLSLMKRAWRYAYFSGARFFAEEYGVCNTFRSLDPAELGPYGEEKREFLRFAEKYPDTGAPYVPFALVLPEKLPMLDINFPEEWFGFRPDENAPYTGETTKRINEAVEIIFGKKGKHGNQGHVLKSAGMPDVFDIIHENSETLSSYEYLIDLTNGPSFRAKHKNVVSIKEADELLNELLPVRINGGLHTAYSKTPGGWLVLCMNNDGVLHSAFSPDVLLSEADVKTKIETNKKTPYIEKLDGEGELKAEGNGLYVSLGAGQWMLLMIREN